MDLNHNFGRSVSIDTDGAPSVFWENRYLRRGILSMSFLSAGYNADHVHLANATHIFRSFHILKRAQLISRFLTLIDRMDDLLDSMPAEKRLALGEVWLGNTPCKFLLNPELGFKKFSDVFEDLEKYGVISTDESYSFTNIFAHFIYEGAKAEIQYKKSKSPEDRKRMTAMNMDLTKALGSNILQQFMPSSRIRDNAKKSNLLPNNIWDEFPQAMALSELIEICDDLEDFLVDIKGEIENAIVTPNWVATRLDFRQKIHDQDGNIQPALLKFVKESEESETRFPFKLSPYFLSAAIRQQQEMQKLISKISSSQRDVISSWWNNILAKGMKVG